MKKTEPLRAMISESAFCWNLRQIQKSAGKNVFLFPVIKANAYGHGSRILGSFIEKNFSRSEVPMVCVARACEAQQLLDSGFKRKILCLNQIWSSTQSREQVVSVVSSMSDFSEIDKIKSFRLHLDFNTGMNRLGLPFEMKDDQLEHIVNQVIRLKKKGTHLAGLMSHLACGEEAPSKFSTRQEVRFKEILSRFFFKARKSGLKLNPNELFIHLANSGGAYNQVGDSFVNGFRPGLHLWGSPATQQMNKKLNLKPVMSVETDLRQLILVKKGEGVGYGLRFVPDQESLVGIFHLGYADGFLRHFPKNGIGLVVEKEWVPVVGRVSMDLCHVDLTRHSSAKKWLKHLQSGRSKINLKAEWIGPMQSADSMAKKLKTIPYEIYCGVGPRAQRIPIK